MATTSIPRLSLPLPFNAQIPVTPPPDRPAFGIRGPAPPQLLNALAQDVYGKLGMKMQEQARQARAAPDSKPGLGDGPDKTEHVNASEDPKYVAMASRIASYYQQRCQAIANHQQQRCQAWATMHRQKCQEMMQAAMLVVAWYIRDRISRRRKRQRRHFKKGLSMQSTRSRVTKGETVRRWVMAVPSDTLSPSNPVHEKLADQEEAGFSMDRDVSPEKDAKLFNVADNLIKSQLTKIDVPLLGAISFDESDSESEEEEEEEYEEEAYEEEDCYEEELAEDDEEYYDDEEEEEEEEFDEIGSEDVQHGTGKGSQKRTSCVS